MTSNNCGRHKWYKFSHEVNCDGEEERRDAIVRILDQGRIMIWLNEVNCKMLGEEERWVGYVQLGLIQFESFSN